MFVGTYLLPLVEPADPGAVADAVAAYVVASQLPLNRITSTAPRVKTRTFKVQKLRELCEAPEMQGFSLWNENPAKDEDDEWDLDVYIRDRPQSRTDKLAYDYEERQGHVITQAAAPSLTPALRTYLEAMIVQHRIAHGFIAGFARYVDARLECMTTALGASERDMAQQERLVFDGRRDQERDKLRRLYPMTIIGPDIWAQLPPMPAFDPMPTIEDLGTCKLLTAWPTLCPPRDPAFLRGTRALREWLWPYTIQNPADHVDKDPAG